jgi:hypothetical protein
MDPIAQLQELRKAVDTAPADIKISNLVPVLCPAQFFAEGKWFGPFQRLHNPDIWLTWCVMTPQQTMRYVDFRMQEFWDAKGLDWRALALANLAEHTDVEKPATHAMWNEAGEIRSLMFMHADGMGPSRLLLRDRIGKLFPKGYRVAVPERSSGMALSVDLEESELATLRGVIDGCYRKGTRPMIPRIYEADDLLAEV